MTSMELIRGGDDLTMVRIVPPQTKTFAFEATKGAYLFSIDVSGSMNAAAEVQQEDGDKVNHGWSQLDIAKHSTNTFVTSLEDDDLVRAPAPASSPGLHPPAAPRLLLRRRARRPQVCIITYSDGATTLLDWTRCDSAGKEKAMEAIASMKPERSTNLMAGLTNAYDAFSRVPIAAGTLSQYALNIIITTDGMPSAQWNPARGKNGYKPLVRTLSKAAEKRAGVAGRITLTSIGLGCKLDSELLAGMSDQFLHMPDPGSVGPFMVNLLAALRCTARLPTKDGVVASHATLVVSPRSALAGPLPGYGAADPAEGEAAQVALGWIGYDQPRHVLLPLVRGSPAITVSLHVSGTTVASASSADAVAANEEQARRVAAQLLRLKTVDALGEIVVRSPAGIPSPQATPLTNLLEACERSIAKAEPDVEALVATLQQEAVLALKPPEPGDSSVYSIWGAHYFRTFRLMLLAERRSNFRDQALQHFGKDADGQEGVFEEQSNEAETAFATMKAPEPSLLVQPGAPAALGVPVAVGGSAPCAPAPVLPAEFMRGGGCFAPETLVTALGADGAPRRVPIDAVGPGDALLAADGSVARVRCVVVTPCAGGRVMLTRMPCGLELTEWHPVLDGAADGAPRWRFPLLLGRRVIRRCAAVHNLLLDRAHALEAPPPQGRRGCPSTALHYRPVAAGHRPGGRRRPRRAHARSRAAGRGRRPRVLGERGGGRHAPRAARLGGGARRPPRPGGRRAHSRARGGQGRARDRLTCGAPAPA